MLWLTREPSFERLWRACDPIAEVAAARSTIDRQPRSVERWDLKHRWSHSANPDGSEVLIFKFTLGLKVQRLAPLVNRWHPRARELAGGHLTLRSWPTKHPIRGIVTEGELVLGFRVPSG